MGKRAPQCRQASGKSRVHPDELNGGMRTDGGGLCEEMAKLRIRRASPEAGGRVLFPQRTMAPFRTTGEQDKTIWMTVGRSAAGLIGSNCRLSGPGMGGGRLRTSHFRPVSRGFAVPVCRAFLLFDQGGASQFQSTTYTERRTFFLWASARTGPDGPDCGKGTAARKRDGAVDPGKLKPLGWRNRNCGGVATLLARQAGLANAATLYQGRNCGWARKFSPELRSMPRESRSSIRSIGNFTN